MGRNTGIAWTDHTFNPWWGCTPVSPGCTNCYAARQSSRFGYRCFGNNPRRMMSQTNWAQPVIWDHEAAKAGIRRRVFCGSMCDVFEDGPIQLLACRRRLWKLIEATSNLDWLILTKRPENIDNESLEMVPLEWLRGKWPKNVWLGVTAERQEQAQARIWRLLQLPAPVRFVSCEPLLGPVDLDAIEAICKTWRRGATLVTYLDWVIAGGESGANARPMHPGWVRSLRDQCQASGVPFFFKQWGEWAPDDAIKDKELLEGFQSRVSERREYVTYQGQLDGTGWGDRCHVMNRVGTANAGRLLDGREHMEYPNV